MKRFAVLFSLATLSAFGALACGGDDTPSGEGVERGYRG